MGVKQLNKETINIVYDIDDVINELNEYVFNKAGIYNKFKDIKYYDIEENTHILTQDEMDKLNTLYEDTLSYKLAKLADGAKDILEIEKLNNRVRVYLYSVCPSKEIAEVKIEYLKKYIPRIDINRCIFIYNNNKEALDNTFIVIDDKLENLVRYRDNVIKVLIDKPYNRHGDIKCIKNMYRVSNLLECNKLIKDKIME